MILFTVTQTLTLSPYKTVTQSLNLLRYLTECLQGNLPPENKN